MSARRSRACRSTPSRPHFGQVHGLRWPWLRAGDVEREASTIAQGRRDDAVNAIGRCRSMMVSLGRVRVRSQNASWRSDNTSGTSPLSLSARHPPRCPRHVPPSTATRRATTTPRQGLPQVIPLPALLSQTTRGPAHARRPQRHPCCVRRVCLLPGSPRSILTAPSLLAPALVPPTTPSSAASRPTTHTLSLLLLAAL